jgi:hypothetical protein
LRRRRRLRLIAAHAIAFDAMAFAASLHFLSTGMFFRPYFISRRHFTPHFLRRHIDYTIRLHGLSLPGRQPIAASRHRPPFSSITAAPFSAVMATDAVFSRLPI